MSDKLPPASPVRRVLKTNTGGELAKRLLDRATERHRTSGPSIRKVRTGFPAIDESVSSWWGVTLLAGVEGLDLVGVAAQIALATAQQDARVLWLALEGNDETPVLRLLTCLSKVRARSIFVERSLTDHDWKQLFDAKDKLAGLPLRFTDAHGASLGDLRWAIAEVEPAGGWELVIIDGLRGTDASLLASLEELAAEFDVAILAVTSLPRGAPGALDDLVAPGTLPLRPGSLVLQLSPKEERGGHRSVQTELLCLGFARVASAHRAEVPLVRFIDIRLVAQLVMVRERQPDQ